MGEDIITTIDALIDEQLAEGESVGGYDGGDPHFPRCPHCDRDWHGFPLTEQVAAMYFSGLFDEGYRVHDDDSSVLCPGSSMCGPARPEAVRPPSAKWYSDAAQWCFDQVSPGIALFTLTMDIDSLDFFRT